MCQATGAEDVPQQRHRAAYLAPSTDRGVLHSQRRRYNDTNDNPAVPLLVEIPAISSLVSPPSSAELWTDDNYDESMMDRRYPMMSYLSSSSSSPPTTLSARTIRDKVWELLQSCYRWMVDVTLVVIMCFVGCCFYDVEVQVVKSNRRRARERRVIIRNEQADHHQEYRRITSLLRSPEDTTSNSNPHWGFV